MKQTFAAVLGCAVLAACASQPVALETLHLGDSEPVMVAKMNSLRARDVTSRTSAEFYTQNALDQRYYWWEMPDKTIVAVLVAAPPAQDLKVVVIETGEPGLGLAGIKNWHSQKLKSQTALPSKRELLRD